MEGFTVFITASTSKKRGVEGEGKKVGTVYILYSLYFQEKVSEDNKINLYNFITDKFLLFFFREFTL